MRCALLIYLLFTAVLAHAQNLTGIWQGHFRSGNQSGRSALLDDRYKFEVQIAQHNKSFEAITYSYQSTVFYGKAEASGSFNPATGKLLLQEGKLLEIRMQRGDACVMTCFLQYSKSGNEEFLEGSFVSMNIRDSSNCGRGNVLLRRVSTSDFYKDSIVTKREKEIEKEEKEKEQPLATGSTKKKVVTPSFPAPKPSGRTTATAGTRPAPAKPAPSLKKPNPPVLLKKAPANAVEPKKTVESPPAKAAARMGLAAVDTLVQPHSPRIDTASLLDKKITPLIVPGVLKSRANELVRSIVVDVNEVIVNIYDDGAIDHDTVSVYLDKKQVVSHAMLTDRPIVVRLHLDDSHDFHELVMVAENEGEIPPNTSLMVVKAGDKEYEVRITSTEQKNAVVIFKYEKKK
jgi:hypothetical protein